MANDLELIEFTPEEIKGKAKDIKNKAEEYKGKYDAFYKEVENLKEAFQGTDAKAFFEKVTNFKANFEKMYNTMCGYVEYLNKSADALSQNTTENTSRASALHNN